MSSLSGARVVVTRARHQAGELTGLLSSRGATVIELPLISVEEPEDAGRERDAVLQRIEDFDWVVVTSPNGAARVAPFLAAATAADPSGALPSIAVVGRATEAVLGRAATLVAVPARAEALVERFPRGDGKVLVVQGDLADGTVTRGIAALGWDVSAVTAYRTVRLSPDPETTLEALGADVLFLASGSAARAWHDAFGERTPPVVVCIGPSTAAEAGALGIEVTGTASHQSMDSMVECAEDILSR